VWVCASRLIEQSDLVAFAAVWKMGNSGSGMRKVESHKAIEIEAGQEDERRCADE